jgi:hypothetical protein
VASDIKTPVGNAPLFPVILIISGGYLAWFGIHYWRSDVKYPTTPVKAVLTGNGVPAATPSVGHQAELTADVAALSPDTSGGSVAASGGSGGKPNAAGYVNPIGKGLKRGRIDEGVDFTGDGPLYAIGSGTIKSTSGAGWPGGTYILLALDNGKFVYYAENVTPMVSAGQKVKAGDTIGYAHNAYPYIEIGWGTSTPQVAAAASHYSEGQQTAEGKDFAALLDQLGAP